MNNKEEFVKVFEKKHGEHPGVYHTTKQSSEFALLMNQDKNLKTLFRKAVADTKTTEDNDGDGAAGLKGLFDGLPGT